MIKIAVVGDVILDVYEHVDVTRLSPEASVPCGLKRSTDYYLGGAANVARNIIALASLQEVGVEVTLVGVIGCDVSGDRVIDLVRDAGIVWVGKRCSYRTITKTRFVNQHGAHLFRWDDEDPEIEAENVRLPNDVDLVVVSDYNKGTFAIDDANEYRFPAPTIINCKPISVIDYSAYENANVVVLNHGEALAFLGGPSSALALDVKDATHFNDVIVTHGERGISRASEHKKTEQWVSAHHVQAVDVCGAGDTTLASLALDYAFDKEVRLEHLENAARHAANVVTQYGTAVPVW